MSGLRPTGKILKIRLGVGKKHLGRFGNFEAVLFFAILFGSWMNLVRLLL